MNDPQSGNDVLLDAFPDSPDHPLISVIPEWPRWAYWDDDPPRKFWLSRVGERLYYVTEFSGEIDLYDGRPAVTPRIVHSVALKRLDPAKWGWEEAITSSEAESVEDLAQRREAIKAGLPEILMEGVL
jgi:hypothetical protein